MTAHSSHPPPRRAWRWWLLGLPLLALALVLGARAFVADVYTVESGSMLPTLRVGERVLVRYARPRLERFDLVVFRPLGGGSPMVKRLGGLPGETVQIVDGDLVIDGAKLGPDAPRPAPVPLFDQALHDPAEWFQLDTRERGGPWTVVDGAPEERALAVDASAVRPGSDAGLAFFHKDLRDGYLEPDGERVPGLAQVNDGVVETRFEVPPNHRTRDGLRVRWRLVEAGDTFEVALGGGAATLTRRPGLRGPVDVLASVPYDLAQRPSGTLRFANVDDWLTVHLDGEPLVDAAYAGNQPFRGVTSGGDRTSAPRVAFGAEGGAVTFRGIRIGRDLHFAKGGSYAADEPLQLGLDEVFLLGDNSTDSADGRYFGPVPLDRLVGEPAAVLQPWSAPRWLGRGRTTTGDGIRADGGG